MTINTPSQLSEITLIQFMAYNQYLNANKEITQEQADKKMVSVFCKLSSKEVNQIPIKDYKEIVDILTATLNESAGDLILQYKGLGFIPNLDDISVSEYGDLELFYTEDESRIDEFMSVLYRPINQKLGKSYTINKYDGEPKHIDEIHQLPMDLVRSAVGFFLDLRDVLLSCTLRYSNQTEAKTQQT
jgi:hypothetical protein